MILQFSVSNFRAFRGLQTLNFAVSRPDKSLPENWVSPDLPGLKNRSWVKGAAIYGANASGKSTVLDAMRSLSTFVRESAKTTDPMAPIAQIEPFAFDPSAASEPTAFAITFVSDDVRYEYRVAATRKRVWHESLRSFPLGSERVWFIREWSDELKAHTFEPDEPSAFRRNRELEKRTLPNMLYLSKCIAENRTEVEPIFRWFVDHLKFLRPLIGAGRSFTMNQLEKNGDDSDCDAILSLLRHADIGITGAEVVTDLSKGEQIKELGLEGRWPNKTWKTPQLFHKTENSESVPLPWDRESLGTKRIFDLAGPILDILRFGRIVCIDELETSMHPLMVRELLRLFFSRKENPNNAQIIFTTHNPLILEPALLRRDQIWFTNKDDEGKAHLYPLTDYQPRKDESLVRGYMAGRYGGIPSIRNGLLGGLPSVETLKNGDNDH